MSALKLTLLQTRTYWHDPAANRAHFESLLAQLADPGDLVVLPEMFTTGFTMDSAAQAEPVDGTTSRWLQDLAVRYRTTLCGSVVIRDGSAHYNRLLWAGPDRSLQHYDKRHRFRMAGEHEHYAAGTTRQVFTVNGVRVCPLICYDLRFPVWSRNLDDYDLLLYVANWPAARRLAWQRLLPARAVENISYVAAVNVIGIDGNGVTYAGGSGVWGPSGAALAQAGAAECSLQLTLDLGALQRDRAAFPAHLDRDGFSLHTDSGSIVGTQDPTECS
ncbi:MAG: amidohydrolase [Pseudomonadota bacterium]